jgi:hypothetical protein
MVHFFTFGWALWLLLRLLLFLGRQALCLLIPWLHSLFFLLGLFLLLLVLTFSCGERGFFISIFCFALYFCIFFTIFLVILSVMYMYNYLMQLEAVQQDRYTYISSGTRQLFTKFMIACLVTVVHATITAPFSLCCQFFLSLVVACMAAYFVSDSLALSPLARLSTNFSSSFCSL